MNILYIIAGMILICLLALLVLKLVNRPGVHEEIKFLHELNKKDKGGDVK